MATKTIRMRDSKLIDMLSMMGERHNPDPRTWQSAMVRREGLDLIFDIIYDEGEVDRWIDVTTYGASERVLYQPSTGTCRRVPFEAPEETAPAFCDWTWITVNRPGIVIRIGARGPVNARSGLDSSSWALGLSEDRKRAAIECGGWRSETFELVTSNFTWETVFGNVEKLRIAFRHDCKNAGCRCAERIVRWGKMEGSVWTAR